MVFRADQEAPSPLHEASSLHIPSAADSFSSGPVLHMKLSDLLNFFQQHDTTQIELQMKCNFLGMPLPYIDINEGSTLGLDGRLEFSLRLSEALLQYMLSSRTSATEITHSGSS